MGGMIHASCIGNTDPDLLTFICSFYKLIADSFILTFSAPEISIYKDLYVLLDQKIANKHSCNILKTRLKTSKSVEITHSVEIIYNH